MNSVTADIKLRHLSFEEIRWQFYNTPHYTSAKLDTQSTPMAITSSSEQCKMEQMDSESVDEPIEQQVIAENEMSVTKRKPEDVTASETEQKPTTPWTKRRKPRK